MNSVFVTRSTYYGKPVLHSIMSHHKSVYGILNFPHASNYNAAFALVQRGTRWKINLFSTYWWITEYFYGIFVYEYSDGCITSTNIGYRVDVSEVGKRASQFMSTASVWGNADGDLIEFCDRCVMRRTKCRSINCGPLNSL